MTEGIYLLHTREFINSKQPIYKIGRSSNMNTRLSQYPKGSNILCSIKCEKSNLCEKELIKLFTKLFTIRKDYGNEYFEGDYNNMLFIIITYLYQDKLNKINFIINDDNNNNTNNDDTNNDDTNNNNNNKISNKNIDYNKFEKNMFDLEKKEKEEKIDGYINDRTCPKCLTNYKYPNMLKHHFENTYHCKKSTKYIKEFFNITKNNKQDKNTNIKFICNKCHNTFTRKADLTRHNLKSKCGKLNNALNIKQCQGINKLTLEQINMLYPKTNILKNIN